MGLVATGGDGAAAKGACAAATVHARAEALRLLDVWGLRICGGSFKDPLAKATGGPSSADDELSQAQYVAGTPGYWVARHAIYPVHAQFVPLDEVRIKQPGERLVAALGRLNWIGCVGMSERGAVRAVYFGFLELLEERVASSPWVPPAHPVE